MVPLPVVGGRRISVPVVPVLRMEGLPDWVSFGIDPGGLVVDELPAIRLVLLMGPKSVAALSTMLFCFDPSNSTSPSVGFSQWMPSSEFKTPTSVLPETEKV